MMDAIRLPKSLAVQVWIDPGWQGAYCAEFVMIHGGCVYVFDEIYERGITAQEVIARAKAKEYWKRVNRGVIDVAGRQHQGMESHVEIWQRLAGIPMYSQPIGIADGILRHRTFLKDPMTGQPRIFFDPRCKGAIREYGLYKYQQVVEGRPDREEPIAKDDHAMKALAYGLVANFGFVAPRTLPTIDSRVT